MRAPHDYIVFPLDVPSLEAAKPFISLLAGRVGMFKIGLELFIKEGPDIISYAKEKGKAKIFLDLKLHDIPATVHRAVKVISDLDADLLTVHCGESFDMLKKAVEGASGQLGILGVTVLTSVASDDLRRSGFQDAFAEDPSKLVMKRAQMARDAGCTGIVCSGQEVGDIKAAFGKEFLAVTPGIRMPRGAVANDDQARVTTPADAVGKGSDYLVIGRPIRDAEDPLAVIDEICEDISAVL